MGSTNFGNQKLSFKFREEAKSQDFNKLNYKLFSNGIYSDTITVNKISDIQVEVEPLIAYLEDSATGVGVRMETTTNAVVDVLSATPYLVLRFNWINSEINYVDFLSLPKASIGAEDLVIARLEFDSGTGELYTDIDISITDFAKLVKEERERDYFQVSANDPWDDKAFVNGGMALINGATLDFAGGATPSFSLPVVGDPRIDLVTVDADGVIAIIPGTPDPSPVPPVFSGASLIVGKVTFPAGATEVRGSYIESFQPYRETTAVGGGASSSTYTAKEDITEGQVIAVEKESAGTKEKFSVTCFDDVSGSLNNKYWTFSSITTDYYVWYNVNSGGLDPSPGGTGIEVAIDTYEKAPDIASKSAQAIAVVATEMNLYPTGGATFYVEEQSVGFISSQVSDGDSNFQFYVLVPGTDVATGGEAIIASKSNGAKVEVVGIAKASVLAGALIEIVKIAEVKEGISGLTPGLPCFLGDNGAVIQDVNLIDVGQYRVYLGVAQSADSLDVLLAEAILNDVIQAGPESEVMYESMPVGAVVPFMSGETSKIPTGYLDTTDGPEVSRIDYWELFDVIGTTYGVGNGVDTFNLPKLNGITLTGLGEQVGPEGQTWGEGTKTVSELLSDQMERIEGHFSTAYKIDNLTGPFYQGPSITSRGSTGAIAANLVNFDTDRVARTGDHTRGPSMVVKYIIKARTTHLTKEQEYAIDARLTELENKYVFDDQFDTGWVANSDWTSQKLGNSPGSNLTHNLNASSLADLDFKIIIGPNDSNEDSFTIDISGGRIYSSGHYGIGGPYWVDANSVSIQTGNLGLSIITDTGVGDALPLDNEAYYYRIIVTKRKGVSALALHQPNTVKDWVLYWYDDTNSYANSKTKRVPSGFYKFVVVSSTGAHFSGDIEIDTSFATNQGVWDDSFPLSYNTATGVWNTNLSNYGIQYLYRWQDSSGLDRNPNPLEDGWETVWTGSSTTVVNDWGTGLFDLVVRWNTNAYTSVVQVLVDDTADNNYSPQFLPANSTYTVQYLDKSDNTFKNQNTTTGTFYIEQIRKFTGKYQLDLTYNNVHLDGNNHRVDSFNTDGGDVDATPYIPSPVQGYKWLVTNAGSSKNVVTGLPQDVILADGQTIEYTYVDNDWTYQNAGIVPLDTIGKDYVEVWRNDSGQNPVTNNWGAGKYRFLGFYSDGVGGTWYIEVGNNPSATTREVSSQLGGTSLDNRVQYENNEFTITGGSTPLITSIERWQDTTGQDAPSVPLKDGWERVYIDYTNTGAVSNTWGSGKFMGGLRDSSNARVIWSECWITEEGVEIASSQMQGSQGGGAATGVRLVYDIGTNEFRSFQDSGTTYLAELWRYTGQLTINKDFTNVSMSGESNEIHNINTNAGDVDGSGFLPVSPDQGYKVLIRNSGWSGNKVINLPKDVILYDNHSIEFIYVDTEWIYQNAGTYSLADISTGKKDWVEVWNDGGADDVTFVHNDWGTGRYRVIGKRTLDTYYWTTHLTVEAIGGNSAQSGATSGTDLAVYYAGASDNFIANGGLVILRIERFQDSEAQDSPRTVLEDGWELAWDDGGAGNITSVPMSALASNLQGLGRYSVVAAIDSTGSGTYTGTIDIPDLSVEIKEDLFIAAGTSTSDFRLNYNVSTADAFSVTINGSPTNPRILSIKKFTGLLRIAADYTTVSLSDGDNQIQELVPVSADIIVTLPATPTAGDLFELYNNGSNGYYVIPSTDGVTPYEGLKIGDGKFLRLRFTGTAWRYEDVIIEEADGIVTGSNVSSGNYHYVKYAGGKAEIEYFVVVTSATTTIPDEPFPLLGDVYVVGSTQVGTADRTFSTTSVDPSPLAFKIFTGSSQNTGNTNMTVKCRWK